MTESYCRRSYIVSIEGVDGSVADYDILANSSGDAKNFARQRWYHERPHEPIKYIDVTW